MHRIIVYGHILIYGHLSKTLYILLVKRTNMLSDGWCISNNRYVNSIHTEYSMVIK